MARNGPAGGRHHRPRSVKQQPGEICAATRTAKTFDPAVTITQRGDEWSTGRGTRTCGRCGRPNVPVSQHPLRTKHTWIPGAWRYTQHTVPTPKEK